MGGNSEVDVPTGRSGQPSKQMRWRLLPYAVRLVDEAGNHSTTEERWGRGHLVAARPLKALLNSIPLGIRLEALHVAGQTRESRGQVAEGYAMSLDHHDRLAVT